MSKKFKVGLIGLVAFISLCSLADSSSSSNPFWDWDYQNSSGPKSLSGTGTCYEEAVGTHYIFWIAVESRQRYRYVDCSTGKPIGEWTDNLNGYSIE